METTEQTTEEQTTGSGSGTGTGLGQEEITSDSPQEEITDKPQEETQATQSEYIGAPETYDFSKVNMPEGFKIDTVLADKFAPIGKELNLSQQAVDKLANFFVQYQQDKLATADEKIAEFRKQELNNAKLKYEQLLNNDKEIGAGDKAKMNAYIDVADVGYNSFASDELKDVLHNLHLDYHPAVIKHFYRLGKLCGNDKIMTSNTPAGTEMSAADIIYANSSKQD